MRLRSLVLGASAALALMVSAAGAQHQAPPVSIFSGRITPLGHQETGSFSGVTGLPDIPSTATFAYVYCTAAVNWRDDGTAPTSATVGTITAGMWFWYAGTLSAFQMIPVSGSATCGANYYN